MAASRSDNRARSLVLPVLLALSGVAPAAPLHVTALVELTVDGERVDSARVRGAFDEALGGAGFTRIAPAAAGVESAADAERGRGYPAADLVVLARVESHALAADLGGTRLARYSAAGEARVLATETGELLGVLTVEAAGVDVGATSAARVAGSHAARALAARLADEIDALVAAPRTLELYVRGLPDGEEAVRLTAALAAGEGIAGVALVAREAGGEAIVRVSVEGLSAAALAERLDGTRGLGLAVESHTLRRIWARYAPARRVSLTVRVERLRNATGEPAEDALVEPLTRVVATALADAPAMRVDASEAAFTVRGAIRYVGQTDAAVDLALRGPDGAVVARSSARGPAERFGRTVRQAAEALADKGLERVLSDRGLRRVAGIALALPRPAAVNGHIATVDALPAVVGAPLAVEVVLRSPAGSVDDLWVELRDAAGRLWGERRVAQLARTGSTTLRFEGPLADAPGSVDVTAVVRDRIDGRWTTERRGATVVVQASPGHAPGAP